MRTLTDMPKTTRTVADDVDINPTLKHASTFSERLSGRVVELVLRRLEGNPRARVPFVAPSQDGQMPKGRLFPPGVVRCMQDIRLRRIVTHAARNSPHYRSVFATAGIDPRDIRDSGDLAKLPFTTPDDFDSESFLAVPQSRIGYIFTTCGTSRRPKRVCFTEQDFARSCNLIAALSRLGPLGRERPLCMIYKQQALWGSADYVEGVVSRLGGINLPIGVPPLAEALQLIDDFKPNMFATSPSYMAALTRIAQRVGFRHRFKVISLGGEILTKSQAELFHDYWGAEVSNGYGLLELQGVAMGGQECDALHVNGFHVFAEIVDPETGRPRDEGELVLTTLVNEAMPLLRYRTRDLCRWTRCRCGWHSPAIQVISRVNDSLVVSANNIHGPVIADGLAEIEDRLTGLEMSVDHVDGVDRFTLRVRVLPDSELREEDVRRELFRIFPVMEDEHRVGTYELAIEIQKCQQLPSKFLRVRDLRTLSGSCGSGGA